VERPSAYHFVMSLMLLPHSSGDGVHPFLDVGWTLVYEMFFYAVLATSLLVRPFHVQTLVIALVLFVMAGLIFDPQLRALKTYSNPILLEFLSGVLLGVLWKSDVKAPAWAGLIIVVLAVTSIFSFWTGEEVGLHRFVFWGVPCAAIVAGFLCMENLAIFRSRVSLLLGASSYSIYLTHTLILLVLGRIWKLMGTPSLPVLIVVPVIMAILVGVGCHLLVEIPMTRFLRDLIQTRRRAAAFGLRS
ncbi:MAG TPA: acyltransferase, partial [Candidatus Saccharimonadales bacterium]|nr:acyltransferase [Candidatus Saccharimonadales bacterium]